MGKKTKKTNPVLDAKNQCKKEVIAARKKANKIYTEALWQILQEDQVNAYVDIKGKRFKLELNQTGHGKTGEYLSIFFDTGEEYGGSNG